MKSKGKIYGGGIGFLLGGPLGAFAGAALGHLFDYKDSGTAIAVSSNRKHYDVLGCSPADSNDTLKKQYRKMVKAYHPDAIAAKGDLPEGDAASADKRFYEVQKAWYAIRKERNI